MCLKLRGLPEAMARLDSPESFGVFQRVVLKRYSAKTHYAIAGRLILPAEAVALGDGAVDVIAESVRRLLLLMSNIKSG